MGRLILTLLLVPSVLLAVFTTQVEPVISEAYIPTTSATQATAPDTNDFNQVGVLVFYPNSSGKPVPYLFYTNEHGGTESKALVFSAQQTNDLSSWSAARISVTGQLDAEHVVVSSVRYLSGP